MDLVTGGSGYFGFLLVQRLLERGRKVRVFDLNDAWDRPPEVDFFKGDIREPDAVRRACEGIDTVYHNVAQVPLAKDHHLFESVNIGGVEVLLKAATQAGVRKLVHTSSSAIFGIPPKNPVDDTVQPRPMEAYGKAKWEGEKLVQKWATEGNIKAAIIRPRTVLGHGRLGIFQILFDWVSKGQNVFVLGSGNNIYQFVHADDLADACILAAEPTVQEGFSVYNIGAEKFGSMRETLEGLIKHAGTESKVKSLPMGPTIAGMKLTSMMGLSPLGAYHSLMYGRDMYFDITRPKRELGWQPRYSNIEMFCDSYDWYLKNKDTIGKQPGASHHRSPVKEGILKLLHWI